MYEGVAEFRFEELETANLIFNEPKKFKKYRLDLDSEDMQEYHLDLLGILNLVLRNRYGHNIIWNDVSDNEELYELIEDLVNEANNDTEFIGFSGGFKSGYVSTFNDNILSFLSDTLYDRKI